MKENHNNNNDYQIMYKTSAVQHNCWSPANWCPDSIQATAAFSLPPSQLPQFYCSAQYCMVWNIHLESLGQLFLFDPLPASCAHLAYLHKKLKVLDSVQALASNNSNMFLSSLFLSKNQSTAPWQLCLTTKLTLSQMKQGLHQMMITETHNEKSISQKEKMAKTLHCLRCKQLRHTAW